MNQFNAFKLLLARLQDSKVSEMRNKHSQKLVNLYGGPIPLKKQKQFYLNLSDIEVDTEMHEIFSLGINCHLKRKFDRNKHKVEIELLFEDIKEKARANKVSLTNEVALKCELERFGTKPIVDHTQNLLSKDQ